MAVPTTSSALVATLAASRKYGAVAAAALQRAAAAALRAHPGDARQAEKAARRRLHQVCGAYRAPDLARLERDLARLAQTSPADSVALAALCERALHLHASTAERLGERDAIQRCMLAGVAPPETVLDLAAGMHVFALPFLGLPAGARYEALEVDGRLVALGRLLLAALGRDAARHQVHHGDVLAGHAPLCADLVLLLKTLPLLERQERGGAVRVLRRVAARRLVVSFPLRSLGGRDKGMEENYRRFFQDVLDALGRRGARVGRVVESCFGRELVFLADDFAGAPR